MTEQDIKTLTNAVTLLEEVRKFIPAAAFSDNSYEHRTIKRILTWLKNNDASEIKAKLDAIFTVEATSEKLIHETENIKVETTTELENILSAGNMRGYLYKLMAEQKGHIIEVDVPDDIQHNNVAKIIINWKSGVDESMKGLSQIVKWLVSVRN